ncbi:hypothetical protein SK128_014709, partial [Halocaridina rubra]
MGNTPCAIQHNFVSLLCWGAECFSECPLEDEMAFLRNPSVGFVYQCRKSLISDPIGTTPLSCPLDLPLPHDYWLCHIRFSNGQPIIMVH